MTKDEIQLLYEFGHWANKRVLHAVSTLSVEEFTRDLGGSFRSVRDTLVHIVGSEWVWLAYWKEPCPAPPSSQICGPGPTPYLIRMRFLTSLRCS